VAEAVLPPKIFENEHMTIDSIHGHAIRLAIMRAFIGQEASWTICTSFKQVVVGCRLHLHHMQNKEGSTYDFSIFVSGTLVGTVDLIDEMGSEKRLWIIVVHPLKEPSFYLNGRSDDETATYFRSEFYPRSIEDSKRVIPTVVFMEFSNLYYLPSRKYTWTSLISSALAKHSISIRIRHFLEI